MNSSKTILAVEDEPHIMRLIQVNLQRAGYEGLMAYSAEQALTIVENTPPALILIDQTLPDMPGNELAKTLRQRYPPDAFILILIFPKISKARGQKAGYNLKTVFL